MRELPVGVYEQLLDEELQELLSAFPDLSPVLRAIDDESAPHSYAQFVEKILKQALRITKKENRVQLVNRVITLLAATDGLEYLVRKRLLEDDKSMLIEVSDSVSGFSRPRRDTRITPLVRLSCTGRASLGLLKIARPEETT